MQDMTVMIKTKHSWRIGRSLVIGLLALLPLSCSLNEDPRDQITEEQAYSNANALFRNTVATLYNYIGSSEEGEGIQGTCRGIYDMQTFGSDEAMIPIRGTDWYDGGTWAELYRHAWTSGHETSSNSWLFLYKVITLCNNSIEQLNAHRSLLTTQELIRYTSEVQALRAICYWYLLDLFARVPIITSTEVVQSQLRQAERSQLFRFVIDELQLARQLLPVENSVKQGDYYSRITYPVVTFVLAKLMLNAEVYADDDWTDGKRPDGSEMQFDIDGEMMNAWEATIFYCNELEAMGFRLEENYSDNFKVNNENSCENIWVVAMDKDLYYNEQQCFFRSWHYRHADAYGFTGENGACATLRTLEIFGYGTDEEDTRFGLNYWGGIVYDYYGDIVTDRTGQPFTYYPLEVKLDLSDSHYVETAGARMKKYEVDKNATKEGKLMDNDIVLFRYADVLLMRAEAKLRNGMDGQADFDAVRTRSHMKPRKISLQNLLDERLLELCWEGWRRQDLIRFNQYESLFMGDEDYVKIDESDGHTTVFPIPSDILNFNPNITQNKGY